MKKVVMALVMAGMAMGMVACSEDGDNCLSKEPKLVAESKSFDAAVKADGVTVIKAENPNKAGEQLDVASDCEKYATNLNAYLEVDEKREALLEAIKDYPKFSGSVLGVLCGALDSVKVLSAATTLTKDIELGQNCITVHANDSGSSSWSGKLQTSLGTLTSADGMTNVLSAAATAAADSASGNTGTGN